MTTAYVNIQLGPGDVMSKLEAVRSTAGVKQAHLTMGPTDMIAVVEVADMQALVETILAIHAVPDLSIDTRLAWPF